MMTNKQQWLAFVGLLVVIITGIWIDVMDIDAAQYASISREMLNSGHYLQVFDAGKDYLDKPPFLFWVSAISMKLLGVGNFGYSLPSLLMAGVAVFSTYRLSLLYYSPQRARLAAWILGCSQGFILMNHDVRTDTVLMGWVIFSIWQLTLWFRQQQLIHLLTGAAGIALGMMTKGPIALLVPAFALGSQLMMQRELKALFQWQHLLALLWIGLLLLPMSWGLYQQFDLHPEKIVNNAQGVSGLRFFYWTQSFGRITGESTWNNNANIFFLLQNMLWSFLPWIICFLIALFLEIKKLTTSRFKIDSHQEVISAMGFLLTYLSLGLSKYQLPHYIFVAFPLAAIITSGFFEDLMEGKYQRWLKPLLTFHFVIYLLLWVALFLLLFIPFPELNKMWSWAALVGLIALIILYFKIKQPAQSLLILSIYTIIGLNLFINTFFYPSLLKFQGGSNMGRWMKENHIPPTQTGIYQYQLWRSVDFYSNGILPFKDSLQQYRQGDYLICNKEQLNNIKAAGVSFEQLHETVDYPITRLSIEFLNPKKREDLLNHLVLLKIR